VTAIGVIPARYASTRFPGKPLHPLLGRPMIQWVCERVARAKTLDEVLVATDDERIRDRVAAFGARVILTSNKHPSGTDRVGEATAGLDAELVVNIQGDEPLIDPADVDSVVQELITHPEADMATLAVPLLDEEAFRDPSVVKVVTDGRGRALMFSRAPIPWHRDGSTAGQPVPKGALQHVGLYAYRREFLQRFCQWGPSPLEEIESLEQLRALEHGAHVRVALSENRPVGVDTPADAAAAEARLREESD
jgi:3-deoxy-manno-octulosonate cytidylyltransferase (CMP-KDO synthetase)